MPEAEEGRHLTVAAPAWLSPPATGPGEAAARARRARRAARLGAAGPGRSHYSPLPSATDGRAAGHGRVGSSGGRESAGGGLRQEVGEGSRVARERRGLQLGRSWA